MFVRETFPGQNLHRIYFRWRKRDPLTCMCHHFPMWTKWACIILYISLSFMANFLLSLYCAQCTFVPFNRNENENVNVKINAGLLLNFHVVDGGWLQVLHSQLLRSSNHLLIFGNTKTLHYLNMYDPTLNATCAEAIKMRRRKKRQENGMYLHDRFTYIWYILWFFKKARNISSEREGACVRQGKWIFNGNIYIAYRIKAIRWCKKAHTHTAHTWKSEKLLFFILYRISGRIHSYAILSLSPFHCSEPIRLRDK